MTRLLFFVFLSLVLIILQTAVLPGFSWFVRFFDLLILNVLYLSLLFSSPFILAGVVLIGSIMDSLSGAPFGVYISVYVWLFLVVQKLKTFVHPASFVFLPIVSALAVLLENAFLIFSFFIQNGRSAVSSQDLFFMLQQILWAFILVPVLILVIHACQKQWLDFVDKIARGMNRQEW